MSVLETPRVYFRGTTTFDPVTTNNYPRNYDEMNAQSVVTPGGSHAALKAAVDGFRAGAVADVKNGSWNPHGTYRSIFYETSVVGVDLGSGTNTTDPFVGVPVSFEGMLVDLEPYGSTSSQLFFDQMSFGIDGGCQVKARRSMRMIARQINFARNPTYNCIAGVASVVWQTSFPKGEGLPLAAHDSTAIAALAKALEAPDVLGLTVRWNAYRTIYYDDIACRNGNAVMRQHAAELTRKLEEGGFQPNPARSALVGVLGLWRKGDAPQVIGDRALLQANSGPIATASARLEGTRLTIDLANSIPETGPDLTKQDYGPLAIVANGVQIATIATSEYDKAAYEATAGIVTCTLSEDGAARARVSDLSLQDGNGTVYLQESALHVCEVTPNTYVESGESATLSVQVLRRGVPVTSGVPVYWTSLSTSAPTEQTSLTDSEGVARLEVIGANSAGPNALGQIDCYVASTAAGPPGPFSTMQMSYLYVRTLPPPAPGFSTQPTWENVYASVLFNWHAMAPCMDNWLRLDDPAQIAAYAPIVRKLTARANFESYRYMPVTRDMSDPLRQLLYAWLDNPTGADGNALEARTKPADANAHGRAFRMG